MKNLKLKRIVIKVGSHVLSEHNRIAKERMMNLVAFISNLHDKYEVIVVSSGAVAAGYSKIKLDKSIVANRQAIAAVGQPFLMREYQKKFEKYDKLTAQFLLTASDFDSRKRTEFAKNAIEVCLKNSIIPIINENDTTATDELVFGDNDRLSAHVTYYFDADMLVILSDIDGYYDKDPRENDNAILKKIVYSISADETNIKVNPNNFFATGGIATKLKAADFLLKRNKIMFMANGFDLSDAKSFLLEGIHKSGTLFCPISKECE